MSAPPRPLQFRAPRGNQARAEVLAAWRVDAVALDPPFVDGPSREAQACLAWLADTYASLAAVEPFPAGHGDLVALHYAMAGRSDRYWSRVCQVLSRLNLPAAGQ